MRKLLEMERSKSLNPPIGDSSLPTCAECSRLHAGTSFSPIEIPFKIVRADDSGELASSYNWFARYYRGR